MLYLDCKLYLSKKFYFCLYKPVNMQLVFSIIGIVLSAILLYFNARSNKPTIYLGIFFILVSIYSFIHYAIFSSGSLTLIASMLVNSGFLTYLIGPSLFLYIRSVLEDDPRLKKSDIFHLVPMVLYLFYSLPYIFSNWQYKMEVARNFAGNTGDQLYFSVASSDMKFIITMFLIPTTLVFVYVLWSLRFFILYLKDKKDKQVFSGQQSSVKWIKFFLGIEILLVTSHVLILVSATFFENNFNDSFRFLLNIMGIGPAALIILMFFSPAVLYGLPRIPAYKSGEDRQKTILEPPNLNEKAQRLKFESGYLESIGRMADNCMEKFNPYTNPEFNLVELSALIHIPVHHLTYYFREEKKQSFTNYRNEWRINYAKKLISEGKTDELTLEAIGLLSGFTTRNTFFTAFKKVEGVSPGAYASSINP